MTWTILRQLIILMLFISHNLQGAEEYNQFERPTVEIGEIGANDQFIDDFNDALLELNLQCTPEGIKEHVKAVILKEAKGVQLKVTDFQNFSFCANEGNKIIGCNTNKPMPMASITKLAFVDFILNNKFENLKFENISSEKCTDKNIDYCVLKGEGYPTLKLEKAISDLCKPDLKLTPCYDQSFLIGGNQSQECKFEYGKLQNNPNDVESKAAYLTCVKENYYPTKGVNLCPWVCRKVKNSNTSLVSKHFSIKYAIPGMLNHSDSFLAQKIGNVKFNVTLLSDLFSEKYKGATTASRASLSCEAVTNLAALKNCSATTLPCASDSETTWSNLKSKSTNQTTCGKTGSAPRERLINFAGCNRKGGIKSGAVTTFAMLFNLTDSNCGTQTCLDPVRNSIYQNLWKILTDNKNGIEGIKEKLKYGSAK
jgi:hypothetical protein